MSESVETLTNALRCARLAVSRLDVGAMGWINKPHALLGTNVVPVTEELMGIIDRALSASADRSPQGGNHEDGCHAKHESAVPKADAQTPPSNPNEDGL